MCRPVNERARVLLQLDGLPWACQSGGQRPSLSWSAPSATWHLPRNEGQVVMADARFGGAGWGVGGVIKELIFHLKYLDSPRTTYLHKPTVALKNVYIPM